MATGRRIDRSQTTMDQIYAAQRNRGHERGCRSERSRRSGRPADRRPKRRPGPCTGKFRPGSGRSADAFRAGQRGTGGFAILHSGDLLKELQNHRRGADERILRSQLHASGSEGRDLPHAAGEGGAQRRGGSRAHQLLHRQAAGSAGGDGDRQGSGESRGLAQRRAESRRRCNYHFFILLRMLPGSRWRWRSRPMR